MPARVKDCQYRKRQRDYDGYKQGSFYYWGCFNKTHGTSTYNPCHFNGNKKLCECEVLGKPCIEPRLECIKDEKGDAP